MKTDDKQLISNEDLKWLLYWAETGVMMNMDIERHEVLPAEEAHEHSQVVTKQIDKIKALLEQCPDYKRLYVW